MAFVIKAKVRNLRAETFAFAAQKTMYGASSRLAEMQSEEYFAGEHRRWPGVKHI
ncbi:MAG: hypothetical protein ACRES6_07245 [Steroidobacteraceae bacterium]